jgi:hypothetical protein
MLVIRGIMVHASVWLVSCLVDPFLWSGLSRDAALGLVFAPIGFVVGLVLLLPGSALWMSPFLLPPLRAYGGFLYHLWVALGAGVALLCSTELGTLGDPRPTMYQYFTPAVLAFLLAVLFSYMSESWPRRVQGLTKRWSERPPVARPPSP